MKVNGNRIDVYHNPRISDGDMLMCLLGFMESEDCINEDSESLIEQTVGRIIHLRNIIRFWFTGLVITNVVWGLHFLGYF